MSKSAYKRQWGARDHTLAAGERITVDASNRSHVVWNTRGLTVPCAPSVCSEGVVVHIGVTADSRSTNATLCLGNCVHLPCLRGFCISWMVMRVTLHSSQS
ncbi:unnamed protein product [Sphacelaria rigidula]